MGNGGRPVSEMGASRRNPAENLVGIKLYYNLKKRCWTLRIGSAETGTE